MESEEEACDLLGSWLLLYIHMALKFAYLLSKKDWMTGALTIAGTTA